MAKDVVFSTGQTWDTNNTSWYTILEHGKARLTPDLRSRFEWHLDAIGLDFTGMTDADAAAMATWLLGAVDAVQASDDRWESERSVGHLAVLVTALREELSRRSAA